MPWELHVIKYDGPPPRYSADSDKNRQLPLGTLEEVRQHISAALPETEWSVEPSVIEVMKWTGSDSWKNWDTEMIEACSRSRLRARYDAGDLTLEMFGFEQPEPLKHFCVDVRGGENPIPVLRALCEPTCWSVAESGKNGEVLDFSERGQQRWGSWQSFLKRAIGLEQ